MTSREFVNNLLHTQYSYDRNVLKTLYNSIKETPFKYQSEVQQRKSTASMGINGHSLLRGSLLINPNEQIDYKHGWCSKNHTIWQKEVGRCSMGLSGEWCSTCIRMKMASRGVNMKFLTIVFACTHLMLKYQGLQQKTACDSAENSQFWEFLFQTSEPDEVVKWINSLNYVAACLLHSSVASPVSSTGAVVFRKPIMPSIPTTLSISEQLHAHQERLEEMSEKLDKLREEAPSIKAKGKAVYDYFYRERYLDKERERYTAYVHILSEKLGATSQADISSLSSKKNSLVAMRHHQTFRQNSNVNGSSDTFSSTSKLQPHQKIIAEEQMEQ
uniref:PH domain-containing protein n=1 Tax=Ditylenchus dipsaci TaxID=166011 RepID=A0A915CYT3_9BILA